MITQSSRPFHGLPAWVLALPLMAPHAQSLPAQQQRYRVLRDDSFRQEASAQGKPLATVPAGVEVVGGAVKDGWVAVSLEGWIWRASLARTDRDGHNLIVTAARGENLRTTRNGAVIARLLSGFLLDEMSRDRAWVRVRRTGWMLAGSLRPIDALAEGTRPSADSMPLSAPTDSGSGGSVLDRAVVAREAELDRLPEGPRQGALAPDAPVRILARSGEWVRVQTEGWIRESDLRPAAPGVLAGLTAAELRTRPQEYEGKLVQWILQYLSLATADELRPEIPLGRSYMLARGPLPEAGFVYVMLSASQLHEARQIPPLAQIVVVARVRNGRSKYLGNPVVELVEMRTKQP